MRIYKENYDNRICVIRTNTYAKNLAHILDLVDIAMKDFPDLVYRDIEVIRYSGERYAKTYGIEFPVSTEIPVEYQPISNLENY